MRRSRSFQKKKRRRNRGSSKTKYSIDKHQTEIRNWRNELIKVLYIVVPSPYQLNWIQIHKKTRAELNRAMGEPTVRHTPAPGNQQSWPKWTWKDPVKPTAASWSSSSASHIAIIYEGRSPQQLLPTGQALLYVQLERRVGFISTSANSSSSAKFHPGPGSAGVRTGVGVGLRRREVQVEVEGEALGDGCACFALHTRSLHETKEGGFQLG